MSSHPVYRCLLTGSRFSQRPGFPGPHWPRRQDRVPGQDRHPQLAAPHFWSAGECIPNDRFCFLSTHFCRAALVAPGSHPGSEASFNDRYKSPVTHNLLLPLSSSGCSHPTPDTLSFIRVLVKNKTKSIASPSSICHFVHKYPTLCGYCWCIGEENTPKPLPCGSLLCQCSTSIQWPKKFSIVFLPSSCQSLKALNIVLNVNLTGNKILSVQGTDPAQVQSNSPLNLNASQHFSPHAPPPTT